MQAWLESADKALYKAKHRGRNRIELAETEADALAPETGADARAATARNDVIETAAARVTFASAMPKAGRVGGEQQRKPCP